MAYDLYAIQKATVEYMRAQFPQYVFHRNTVPEDEQVPREGEEVNPFFILQFGTMYPMRNGKSIKGPRNDDYSSWVQVIGIGSVEDDISAALSLVVDRLIGYKPPGGTGLTPDGNMADYGSRQYSVRPVLYYQSQKFNYTITQNGLDGYLSA
jgi:hypothetical protein